MQVRHSAAIACRSGRFPMPVWLFERFVGPDLTRMWHWLATHDVEADVTQTRSLHPVAATIEEFIRRRT